MDEKFVIKKDVEQRQEKPTIDEKRPRKARSRQSESDNLFKSARQLLETFGHAKLGRTIFGDYAIEFQLKDNQPSLFYLFMLISFALDLIVAVFIVGLISIILIAFVYVTLRGVDAWQPTVHILHVLHAHSPFRGQ